MKNVPTLEHVTMCNGCASEGARERYLEEGRTETLFAWAIERESFRNRRKLQRLGLPEKREYLERLERLETMSPLEAAKDIAARMGVKLEVRG